MANFLKRWYTGLKTATTTPTLLETHVQDTTIGVQERLALEHQPFNNGVLDTSLATAGGRHKAGSCSVCFYGATTSFPAYTTVPVGAIAYSTTTSCFYVNSGSAWVVQYVPNGVPSGAICLWAGSYYAPPAGWHIFSAAFGKFLFSGYPGWFDKGSVGGGTSPTLPAHTHTVWMTTSQSGPWPTATGPVSNVNSPDLTVPYYSIYLIQKD